MIMFILIFLLLPSFQVLVAVYSHLQAWFIELLFKIIGMQLCQHYFQFHSNINLFSFTTLHSIAD